MKKILLSCVMVICSFYANAGGGTHCHTPVETQRSVKTIRPQGFVKVSAQHFDSGCVSNLKVTLNFVRPLATNDLSFLDFMAIRNDRPLGFPYPLALNVSEFEIINDSQIVINRQLQLGDTLFIDLSSVGMFPFLIE